jgi:hypothetical protein
MSTPASPIIGVHHIEESQDDKEVTANEHLDELEGALQDFHTEDCAGSSNVTIATADASLHQFFDLTGLLTGNIDVIVPANDAGPPAISYAKTYIVRNSTTGDFTITFKPSGGTGVVLPRTGWQLVRSDGTDMEMIADLAYVAQQYYGDGAIFGATEMVFMHVFSRAVDTPVDMMHSEAYLDTAANAQTDFDVHKNTGSIGTLRFAAAGQVGTWVSTIAAQSFAKGDRLRIFAPGTPDTTAKDIAITIRGVPA